MAGFYDDPRTRLSGCDGMSFPASLPRARGTVMARTRPGRSLTRPLALMDSLEPAKGWPVFAP